MSNILSKLQGKYRTSIGLYRDDGLAAFNCTPRQMENIKKQICEAFCGLQITVIANKKIVNFLDVTFDLQKNSYGPHIKPSNIPRYVSVHSNHPPMILRNLPKSINKPLCAMSSSEEEFNNVKPVYQKALLGVVIAMSCNSRSKLTM